MNDHNHAPPGFVAWLLGVFAGLEALLHDAGLTAAHVIGALVLAVVTGFGAGIGQRLARGKLRSTRS